MKKWDYLFINVGEATDWISLQDKFRDLGRKGWELVTVAKDIHVMELENLIYIFKKPLEE